MGAMGARLPNSHARPHGCDMQLVLQSSGNLRSVAHAPLLRLHHRAGDFGLNQPHLRKGLGEKVLLGGGSGPLLVGLQSQWN